MMPGRWALIEDLRFAAGSSPLHAKQNPLKFFFGLCHQYTAGLFVKKKQKVG
jgi:hypothetical protein